MQPSKHTYLPERFWSKINNEPDNNGCWIWNAGLNGHGYAYYQLEGKSVPAHRLIVEDSRGMIPKGLQIDHLCKVHNCVNPEHLEVVTRKENIRRSNAISSINTRKTHCIHGHEFDKENTYYRPTGGRRCRACLRDGYKRNHSSIRKKQNARYHANKVPKPKRTRCGICGRLASWNSQLEKWYLKCVTYDSYTGGYEHD